ncbi:MAG: hypothetical protein IKG17_11125 [Mogibacterium sp.]|nr:hypothetical protein [Mogibacterium sp.]
MDRNKQDIRYEDLYNRLLDRGMALHENNKKRIRAGLVLLGVFTVLMILIRMITNSDRVVFMILWVVGMFVISIYLISVEYIDDSIRKTLEEVSDREADFGELIPDSEQVRERVQSRIQVKQEEIQARYMDHRRNKAPESEDEE